MHHEYVAGRAYAMAGASYAHNLLVANLHLILGPAARPSCRVLLSDMKLKIDVLGAFYYPDLMLICEQPHNQSVYVLEPKLIVEVLSPSTESIDRREKAIAYRSVRSLTEYLMVHQDERRIEVQTKDAAGNWTLTEYADDACVPLSSLPCGEVSLDMKDVYNGIDFNQS
jgi:Uma2 family endonuclease